jgi:predicted MPP superfamily phosphohydrolase
METSKQMWTRRDVLKGAAGLALRAGLLGLAGAGYTTRIEPRWLDIEPVTVTLPRLDPAFHGYRVVQLSDLHLGDWLTRPRLEEVVALVNTLQPDLIAITGDFVTRHPADWAHDLIGALRPLRARDGVVAILGNHDQWPNPAIIRQVLRESNIRDLSNTVETVRRGGAALHLAGVDDVYWGYARLDAVLARLPLTGAALLMAHEPDFADTSAATGRFDLQLSGHSHGGQVVLPFLGPPTLPEMGECYPSGRYQVGGMIQYTNRGLGMVRPHVRLNCRPEITLLALQAVLR